MKKTIIYTLLLCLVALPLLQTTAQPVKEATATLSAAFPAGDYGKKIEGDAQMSTEKMDELEAAIRNSFAHDEAAQAAIGLILAAGAKDKSYTKGLEAAFAEFKSAQTAGVDAAFALPEYEPDNDEAFRQHKLGTAAQLALGIHSYYQNNPASLSSAAAKAFYGQTPAPQPDPTPAAVDLSEDPTMKKALSSASTAQMLGWLGILLGLAGLALGALAFLRTRKKEDTPPPPNPVIAQNQQKAKELEETIHSLEEKIAGLEAEVDKLEAQQITYKPTPPPAVRVDPKEKITIVDESASMTQLYTTNPRKNVFFTRYMSENMRPKEHIVRIDIINEKEAEYTLVTHPESVKKAFAVPNTYLQPCFDMQGRPSVQSYRVTQKGKLKKEGENWRIVEKGVITGG